MEEKEGNTADGNNDNKEENKAEEEEKVDDSVSPSKNDFERLSTYKLGDGTIQKVMACADIHMIVACPFAILLPLAGFVCACILMRYNKDYTDCLTTNNVEDGDYIRMWIRVFESLTFAYSLSYFFFVAKAEGNYQLANLIFFESLNIAFVVCSVVAMGMRGSSKCKSTAFGKTILGMGITLMICGIFVLIVHTFLYFEFINTGKLRLCGIGDKSHKVENVSTNVVKPEENSSNIELLKANNEEAAKVE